ncbi:hypothetical protein RDI58_023110 [Solanum bulbocastanum]|uniref:F-box domain-containing protein n=1 Tax=Solanum bulbocastanum TaxID=147425 RepID=A0AAN8Y6T7_SOLBU
MKDSILTLPAFPSELIVEILLRVPVKFLLQFRCVSKSWLALISSPKFVKTHLSLSVKNKDYPHHRVVLTVRNESISGESRPVHGDYSLSSLRNDSVIDPFVLDFPMKKPQQGISIVGSVNGLICVAIGDGDLFICNPSIRKFKNLPDSRLKLEVSEGYDGSPCGVIYGFGYDKSSDDYKVVCFA